MKLVIHKQNEVEVNYIQEFELDRIIEEIRSMFFGHELKPLAYEIFRYKIYRGIIIIYKENRSQRMKNSWYEIRGLKNLSREYNTSFYHNVYLNYQNSLKIETEVDGLDVENKDIMVEIKNALINNHWINFYEKKRKELKMKDCIIIGRRFQNNLRIPPKIRCFLFIPDFNTLMTYYTNQFSLPSWFSPFMRWRHLRILLSNGTWFGMNRKLTKTAKHSPTSKIRLILNNLSKKNLFPNKIYYSLSPMAQPVQEFYGKGRPFPYILAALDIDSDHNTHIIGREGYCLKCLEESEVKARIVSNKIQELGYQFIKVHSGSKGYHFYLIDTENEKRIIEFKSGEYINFIKKLVDNRGVSLVDNSNFRAKDGTFDSHRIFKLPYSVDLPTGIIVKEKLDKLEFKDFFIEYPSK